MRTPLERASSTGGPSGYPRSSSGRESEQRPRSHFRSLLTKPSQKSSRFAFLLLAFPKSLRPWQPVFSRPCLAKKVALGRCGFSKPSLCRMPERCLRGLRKGPHGLLRPSIPGIIKGIRQGTQSSSSTLIQKRFSHDSGVQESIQDIHWYGFKNDSSLLQAQQSGVFLRLGHRPRAAPGTAVRLSGGSGHTRVDTGTYQSQNASNTLTTPPQKAWQGAKPSSPILAGLLLSVLCLRLSKK